MSNRFHRNSADIAVRGCPECGQSQTSGVIYPSDWVVVCETCHRRGPADEVAMGKRNNRSPNSDTPHHRHRAIAVTSA